MAQNPPKVVLCDGVLPDMDVAAFAQAARSTLGDAPVFIIAWSSDPDAEDRLLVPEVGINDFVLKSANNENSPCLTSALLGGLR